MRTRCASRACFPAFRTRITCEYPPPAAPPLMPKVGPWDGCRTQAIEFFFNLAPRAWVNPMVVVLFPSPRGVGVMPEGQRRPQFKLSQKSVCVCATSPTTRT